MANIAYIPSYKPKNPKPTPKLLEDEEGWENLVKDVENYISTCKAKNKGKGVVKPFTINLIDTSGGDPKDAGTSGTGKKGKKSKQDEPQAAPALKEHDLFQQLEQKHFCQECKKPCVILDSGDHHVLTHSELATWALLLSRHQATLKDPPAELKLELSHGRQRKAKTAAPTAASSSDPPIWIQHLVPVMGALLGNRAGYQLSPTVPLAYGPADYSESSASVVGQGNLTAASATSASELCTGTKRGVSESVCPDVGTWLTELDSDPVRGRMGLNYAQYRDCLVENGFFELSDMAKVDADKLMGLVGIKYGIANRLVTYAREDYEDKAGSSKRAKVN
ncbi:hypothetical protein B0H11DRAFT_1877432 [Mycena galericulata]|nr:hypothetical protein B0H11DRAFT_1877432 [Mycena galericulata]